MSIERPTKQKLWGGRFTGKTDPLYVLFISDSRIHQFTKFRGSMHQFNQSLKYDQRMHAADIRGSIAYAKALRLAGILTDSEQEQIIQGLKVVGKEWEGGVVRVLCLGYLTR